MLSWYGPRRLTSSRVEPGGIRKGSARLHLPPRAWVLAAGSKKAARRAAAALPPIIQSLIRRRGHLVAGPLGQPLETVRQREQLFAAAQIEPQLTGEPPQLISGLAIIGGVCLRSLVHGLVSQENTTLDSEQAKRSRGSQSYIPAGRPEKRSWGGSSQAYETGADWLSSLAAKRSYCCARSSNRSRDVAWVSPAAMRSNCAACSRSWAARSRAA